MTGLAQAIFPTQGRAAVVELDGKVVGLGAVGKEFTGEQYFPWPPVRPPPRPIRRMPPRPVPAPV